MSPETEELVARVLAKLEVELDIRAKQRAGAQAERDFYDGMIRKFLPPKRVPQEGGDYPVRPQPDNDTGVWEKKR